MTDKEKLLIKLKKLRKNITPGIWFATDLAGYWCILNGAYYEADDILDSDKVGKKQSKANAELIAMTPEWLDDKIVSLESEAERESFKTAEEFVNEKMGDKRFTHSPMPQMYRRELEEWLIEFARQSKPLPTGEEIHFAGKKRYNCDIVNNGEDKAKLIKLASVWREGANWAIDDYLK